MHLDELRLVYKFSGNLKIWKVIILLILDISDLVQHFSHFFPPYFGLYFYLRVEKEMKYLTSLLNYYDQF